jgi:hypothetical protein
MHKARLSRVKTASKLCVSTLGLVTIFQASAISQTYSHKFVQQDGSILICSTTYSGNDGRTQCNEIPASARTYYYTELNKRMKDLYLRDAMCSEKSDRDRESDPMGLLGTARSAAYRKCMGVDY